MKITGTSSYIKVEIDSKTVKIQGEMLIGGFLAYSDTIKNWEPPYENVMIDDVTKAKIIKEVIDETKDSNFKIEFE
jgi:Immunity protein 74